MSGSDLDIQYYKDTQHWNMGGQTIPVVDNNEHLGQIVSGSRQEQKNIDLRIEKSRNTLFGLLGPAFSFNCLLSPVVKLHIYRTFICPVMRSGKSTFVLNSSALNPLSIFQRKSLKGILQLSKQASTPALHFLTGELPIEAKIHQDIFSLFYSVWCNPNSKIYSILKYLMTNSNDNSRTWAINVKHLSAQYGLEDPVNLLKYDPPPKSSFKNDIATRVKAFHEKELRCHEDPLNKLKYLHVSLTGLSGRRHPALSGLFSVNEVRKSRPHVKMLVGDFYTYERKSEQSGGSPNCRLCSDNQSESISHILAVCSTYSDIRVRILGELSHLCLSSKSEINFQDVMKNSETLCQFILDPSSMNLSKRIHMNDPLLDQIFKTCRDFCYCISEQRIKLLNEKETS